MNKKIRDELFAHIQEQHNLILLESEIDEIIKIVEKDIKQTKIKLIEDTVIECAKNAKMKVFNTQTEEEDYLNLYECGDDEITISRNSIFDVALMLKNEL